MSTGEVVQIDLDRRRLVRRIEALVEKAVHALRGRQPQRKEAFEVELFEVAAVQTFLESRRPAHPARRYTAALLAAAHLPAQLVLADDARRHLRLVTAAADVPPRVFVADHQRLQPPQHVAQPVVTAAVRRPAHDLEQLPRRVAHHRLSEVVRVLGEVSSASTTFSSAGVGRPCRDDVSSTTRCCVRCRVSRL